MQELGQEPDELLQGQIQTDEDGTFFAIRFHDIPDEEEAQREIICLIVKGIAPQLWSDGVAVEIKSHATYTYYPDKDKLASF